MRSSSLARVVTASLSVSVVITLGCARSPGGPSPPPPFSVLSIFPAEGLTVGATIARIAGTGFQSGATVTVDGSRVDATVLSANTISLSMPAHAEGKVDVTVIGSLSQAQASVPVPGGYTYVGPLVISELRPNIGSTGGFTTLTIRGSGFRPGLTVRVGSLAPFVNFNFADSTTIQISTPAHAAGTVEVIVKNPDGQAGSGEFTYASPATFDFNGDWQGEGDNGWDVFFVPVVLTIRDNIVVNVSCGGSSLTLDPPPVVANGQFLFVGSGGVRITGDIDSPISAYGTINMASCVGYGWRAEKKQ